MTPSLFLLDETRGPLQGGRAPHGAAALPRVSR